jgi:hypothetical protein
MRFGNFVNRWPWNEFGVNTLQPELLIGWSQAAELFLQAWRCDLRDQYATVNGIKEVQYVLHFNAGRIFISS